jgi:hypothetical protein
MALLCQKPALPTAYCSRLFLHINKRGPTYNVQNIENGDRSTKNVADIGAGGVQMSFTAISLFLVYLTGVTGSESNSVEKLDDIVP